MTKVQVKDVNRSGLDGHTSVNYHEVDFEGNLYLFINEYGPFALVRADNFEDAFGELMDESTPIDQDDFLGHYWQYEEYTNPLDILYKPMSVVPTPSDEYAIDWEDFQNLFDCVDTDTEHSDRAKVVLTSLDDHGQLLPHVQSEIIDGDTYLKYLVYNVLNGHNMSIALWENMAKILDKHTVAKCIADYFTDLTDKIEKYLGYEINYQLSLPRDVLRFIDSLDKGFFGIVGDQPIPDDVLILEVGDLYGLSICWNEYKYGGIFEFTTLGDLRDEYEQDVKNGEYDGHGW